MDNLQLRVIASYLNAKVEVYQDDGNYKIKSIDAILNHYADYDPLSNFTLLLRSLDNMKEEEAKYWTPKSWKFEEIIFNGEFYAIRRSIPEKPSAKYLDLLMDEEWQIRNADKLRSKNFITDFEGKDIIGLGFAKIDNEAYVE